MVYSMAVLADVAAGWLCAASALLMRDVCPCGKGDWQVGFGKGFGSLDDIDRDNKVFRLVASGEKVDPHACSGSPCSSDMHGQRWRMPYMQAWRRAQCAL